MKYLSRGKRGEVFLTEHCGKTVVVKRAREDVVMDTIEHEANMLRLVNDRGIGPKFIRFDGALMMEYIEGEEIDTWLCGAASDDARRVILEILAQARALDEMGLNKFELHRPYKHIIVRGGKPVMIDFERVRRTEKPKNVTQVVQWLTGKDMAAILPKKGIVLEKERMMELARRYKERPGEKTYLRILGELQESLRGRVYVAIQEIPSGRVSTYKDVALKLGTNAYRSVGQALKRNPCAPEIPCHRVVASDGSIGGFNGSTKGAEIDRKIERLRREGVIVENGKIKDFNKKRFA